MREGGCHGGGICFDNHSFPKIPGNHVPGLTAWKSLRSKDWDKVLFLSTPLCHSLLSLSPSASVKKWHCLQRPSTFPQKVVAVSCWDPVACEKVLEFGWAIGFSKTCLPKFIQFFWLSAQSCVTAVTPLFPNTNILRHFLCRIKCLQILQVGCLMLGKPPAANPCPAHFPGTFLK